MSYKEIQFATNDELKEIISALMENTNVLSLDIQLIDDILEMINEELEDWLIDYLYENYEEKIEEYDFDGMVSNFFNSISSQGLEFYKPYIGVPGNLMDYNRWETEYSFYESFMDWCEMDVERIFRDNFSF
jgi:hypothetical protein